MDLKKMGNALKLLRNSKELSLEKEAQLLGIHRNTLAMYEENPENMSIGLFRNFLDIYDMSMSYFFTNIYDNSLNNQDENKSE